VDLIGIIVLSTVGVATGCLWWYGKHLLPQKTFSRFDECLKTFSAAIEHRFPSMAGTTKRVVSLSHVVGRELGLTVEELRDLRMAARLRDVGLSAVPYRLNGAESEPWSHAEEAAHARHPEVSGAMLEIVPSLRHLARMVRCHHSPFDGSTGPFFPARDDIPVQARIIAVVDAYVWSDKNEGNVIARTRMEEGKGSLYDPRVVECLQRVIRSAGANRRSAEVVRR